MRTSGETLSCERIGNELWWHVGLLNTCWMHISTEISEPGVILSSNASVKALSFAYNKRILYLPSKISVSFPSLECYVARSCYIKEISKDNFEQMKNLRRLDLKGNKIEIILSDAFEDMIALQWLYLGMPIHDHNNFFFHIYSSHRWQRIKVSRGKNFHQIECIATSLVEL